MEARLTPMGWTIKFIILPLIVLLIGYFLIGPQISAFQKHEQLQAGEMTSDAPAKPTS